MEHPRSFRLASSEFPSGVSWLLNFFVELDILIYNTKSIQETWTKGSDGSYALTESELVTKKYVPALSDSSIRKFRDDIIVRWSHEFPLEKCKEDKVILLVRDGRDAIYSLFKRKNITITQWMTDYFAKHRREASFLDWLRSGYGSIRLTPPEIWALFHYLWLACTPESDLLIIRFDDLKANPEKTIAEVLSFMDLVPDRASIAHAIQSCDFERTKKVEERFNQEHSGHHNTMIRKGALREWPEAYRPIELKTFEGFPSVILALFGYEVPEQNNNIEIVKEWDQSKIFSHISTLRAQYRLVPHLENYWKKYKRREFYIGVRGKIIAFLKQGRWILVYTIIKTPVDVYRAIRKRYTYSLPPTVVSNR